MAKKFTASSEVLRPDSKFNSKLVSQVHQLHDVGRQEERAPRTSSTTRWRSWPRRSRTCTPLEIFETAINNVKPTLEVRSKRVGGASYQVPMQVNPKRQQSLAFRWILASARGKKGKPMAERLAAELIDAYNRTGRRDDDAGKRAPHGRGQQGVRPLRLVGIENSTATVTSREPVAVFLWTAM